MKIANFALIWIVNLLLAFPLFSKRIADVKWIGNNTLSHDTLEYYLGIKKGSELDWETLNKGIHNLWDKGLIDDIKIKVINENERDVELEVYVKERPILLSLVFEGFKKLSKEEVRDELDKEKVQLVEGLPLDKREIKRAVNIIKDYAARNGFNFAQVSYRLEDVRKSEVRLVISIDEGEKIRIGKITFEGNTVFSDWRLRWALKKTKKSGIISRIRKIDIYDESIFAEDLNNIRKLYLYKGYKDLIIEKPEIKVINRGRKRRLHINISLKEGKRWKLGTVRIEGNEYYQTDKLLSLIRVSGGDWLYMKEIEESVERISNLYQNTGFIFSQVKVDLVESNKDGTVDAIIKIEEGDQYRIGRIEFVGNTKTRDKVLRRELRVFETAYVNRQGIKNSLLKIQQLGFFKLDEDNPVEFKNFDVDKKTVDLVIKGEEGDRTELMLGAGWSEIDGFFGQVSFRTRNFLGRGETLSLSLQEGRVRDIIDLSYFIPWFLDKPQSLGFRIFDRDDDLSILFDQELRRRSKGASFSYGRSFRLFNSVRLSYGYTSIFDLSSVTDPATGEVITREFDYDKSQLTLSWLYDSRDNLFEPTRGMRSVLSYSYAGGLLGGGINLDRMELSFSYFRPVTEGRLPTVFAFNLEGGKVRSRGELQLPFLELYYRGGEYSVRGFARRSLVLRDENGNPVVDENGFILGGNAYLETSLEYHFLLGGPFRLIAFFDAGNVFADSIKLSDLRTSSGLELRIFVPALGVPLRFIYSYNLDPKPYDRFDSFQFTFGVSF